MAKSTIFWTPISTVLYTTNTVNERLSSTCVSMGEIYFGKARGSQVSKTLWNLKHVIGNFNKPAISIFWGIWSSRPTSWLLKIGENFREHGKTWKMTNLQNQFWSSQCRTQENYVPSLFWSVSGWHTTPVTRRAGFVLKHFPFTNAASQWLYVNLVCRFHTCLGRFSLALRLPPTPKNLNPSIFLVDSFWSLYKPAWLP